MSNELTFSKDQSFSLVPTSLKEALEYAQIMCETQMVPQAMRGKPGEVLAAVQMGLEVGLTPMVAIQNIALINGRATMWGDAVLALVRASGTLEDIEETLDTERKIQTCRVKRVGVDRPVVHTFSWQDAVTAGLSNKQGTWQTYPKRMLQMRARSFALRDLFPDVLKGIYVREEVMDYHDNEVTITDLPKAPSEPTSGMAGLAAVMTNDDNLIESDAAAEDVEFEDLEEFDGDLEAKFLDWSTIIKECDDETDVNMLLADIGNMPEGDLKGRVLEAAQSRYNDIMNVTAHDEFRPGFPE